MTKNRQIKTAKRLRSSKAEREAYVTSQINVGIPFQIRALRKRREWDQNTLALKAGMAQSRISVMERVGYATLNIATLKRLASAFDVGLMVRFVPFGELIRWEDSFSPDTFSVPPISEELLSGDTVPKLRLVATTFEVVTAPRENITNVLTAAANYDLGATTDIYQSNELLTEAKYG